MTALTLTPRPTVGASVLVQVTGAPAGALTITRTDANGARDVRLQAGQTPIGGVLTIPDFEAALVGTISYRVRDSAGVYTTATTTLEGLAVYPPHLLVVAQPQVRTDLWVVMDNQHGEDANTSFHDVIGRADAIPTVTGPLQLRDGTLTVRTHTYADNRTLRALAGNGQTLMFRQPDHAGMDTYLAVQSFGTAKAEHGSAGWTFDAQLVYRETAPPVTPLRATLGWDYAASLAYSGTYVQSGADFRTYADLNVGPPPAPLP